MKDLPNNLTAERAVISASIDDYENAVIVINSLSIDDFYDEKNKVIFKILHLLYEQNIDINLTNIIARLEEENLFEEIGGFEFIASLTDEFIYTAGDDLDNSIKILQDKGNVRKMLLKFDELSNKYYGNKFQDDNSFLAIAEREVDTIASNRRVEGFKNLNEISKSLRNSITISKGNEKHLIGVDTGYNSINNITLGLAKGELVVLAARPSVGKTAFGVNVAFNVASIAKAPVLAFSLEMSAEALGSRILAMSSSVELGKIMSGKVTDKDMLKVEAGVTKMMDVPLFIDATPGIKIGDIVTKSKKFKADNPNLQMLLIDYLGLVNTEQKFEAERFKIGYICHTLKALSTELEIPIILISQLSRAVEGRKNRRPAMSDLRESGDIEQDADKIILLYRDDYYADKVEEEKEQEKNDKPTGTMVEVDIVKNRNGKTSTAFLWFFKSISRFSEPHKEAIDEYIATRTL